MLKSIIMLAASMVAAKDDVDEEVVDLTTTIEVDKNLNFTYSVEMFPSNELYGLVPNLTNPETC